MNTYRHRLIIQTLALLPVPLSICLAAYAAHRQQGTCPPVWRPFKFYQYRRRQQALRWLLDAVARSLQGHMFVGTYFQAQGLPDRWATVMHVRTTYLQDLLNHTTEDNPTLQFENYLPTKPTGPALQNLPGCI